MVRQAQLCCEIGDYSLSSATVKCMSLIMYRPTKWKLTLDIHSIQLVPLHCEYIPRYLTLS